MKQANKLQTTEWYKHGWGLIAAILLFPYFIVWYAWSKSGWSKNVKIAVTSVVALLMLPIIIGSLLTDTSQQKSSTNKNTNNQTATMPAKPEDSNQQNVQMETRSAPQLPVDPIERITNIAKQKYSNYEVSLYTRSAEFAKQGNGPWEVLLNSPLNSFSNCSAAKQVIYETMKALFTDEITKTNIIRLKISLSNQAQASLGQIDAKPITDKNLWASNGPSNFAKSLAASGAGDDSGIPLDNQTYWSSINGNCSP